MKVAKSVRLGFCKTKEASMTIVEKATAFGTQVCGEHWQWMVEEELQEEVFKKLQSHIPLCLGSLQLQLRPTTVLL